MRVDVCDEIFEIIDVDAKDNEVDVEGDVDEVKGGGDDDFGGIDKVSCGALVDVHSTGVRVIPK